MRAGVDVDYVFCLTGNPSSGKQSVNCNVAMFDLGFSGKKIGLRHAKSCNIYVVRNGCLTDGTSRKNQRPFDGMYRSYDRMIWVDSDNIITAQDIKRLIDHDVDICAAWYRQYSDGPIGDHNKAACGISETINGRHHSRAFLVGEMESLPVNEKGLIEVDYAGMGLMVIKKGVFEALTYPWFTGGVKEWVDENGVEMADVITDDEGFCKRVKEAGFKVFVDPQVRISHQRMVDV